ncbi:MAG: glycosyltransferase family 4 protein [Nitrospinales bacterium]
MLNTHGSLLGYRKYLPAGFQRLPYEVYDRLTFKRAAKAADAVVVSSKFEYEDAVEFGIDRKKLRVIPMGIDIEPLPERRGGEGDAALQLLFVGRLARVRRVELLLQAAAKLSFPYHVTIVGGEEKTAGLSPSGYLDELKKLCGDLGIAEHVTFAGAQPPEAVRNFYREADVFVYPSLYENFGQPVLEAAAAGLPVVATGVGVAREIVRDGETGFLVPGEPERIAERIKILAEPATRAAFGNAIRATVQKDFSWDDIIQRYVDLYKSF